MKIVGVTACPTGVAHTYMAQQAIEEEAKKRGYEVKIETQGSMGIENELEQYDIDSADVVILAIAITIDGEDRFYEKEEAQKVINIEPGEAIKNIKRIIDKAEMIANMEEK